ncbi:MAG: adenine phosphoribosyltransferase [Alphaproteobacteria bacterium CG11_big_fil_rev_8_21_14_0_20_39_49]|nr:MAG: adenine phosphoribosyltransferase [Alphaproteobacteria bacterium CG11_big_fil_rev_8_21_14_0_20_39_49]
MNNLKQYINSVPNFPKQGIIFRDISPLLRDKYTRTVDELSDLFTAEEWNDIDVIAGIESRGFIFASGLAYKNNKGMVKIRKSGKLPNVHSKISYGLEYGDDALEMQKGGGNILIVDDVLATGGTLTAAAKLCEQTNHKVAGIAVLINLTELNDFRWNNTKVRSVIEY